ncbi:MAG: glycosyltransferase [Muribaculaceae bacterium]|nr:glycosyltransferase [Muribaculaceae bacterium]
MHSPLISIIVPVYNAEKYLRQCVNSVLSQSYSAWELILIDDGSSDDSSKICDEFASGDHDITVIHLPNSGVSAARNAGIDMANGKYITFLDADDILHPSFLSSTVTQAEKLKKNSNLSSGVIVQTLWTSFTHNPPAITSPHNPKCLNFSAVSGVESILYQKKLCCSVWATLYSTSLFNPAASSEKIRFAEGLRYEDLDIAWRLMLRADGVSLILSQLYLYRIHKESFLNNITADRADVLKVTERMLHEFAESSKEIRKQLLPAARDRRLSAAFNIYCLMQLPNSLDNSYKTRVSDECKEIIRSDRLKSLFNRKVRIKNKAGILLSYIGGFRLIRLLSPVLYH